MTGHEARMQGIPGFQHRLLDRTDVGDHGILRQSLQQIGSRVQQEGNRQGQDHQITAAQTGRIRAHRRDKPTGQSTLSRCLTMHQTLHPPAATLQVEAKRSADQAQTDHPRP